MKFGPYAALAELQSEGGGGAIRAIPLAPSGFRANDKSQTIAAGIVVFATTDCPESRAEARAWIKAHGLTREDVEAGSPTGWRALPPCARCG